MSFKVFFGAPGSGKSTHAARIAYLYASKGIQVYSNVDIVGVTRIDSSLLGKFYIGDGVLILDEAGIDFNNRLAMSKSSKAMSQDAIQFFKLYRHYGITDIYLYSQSYEDFDVTLRRLADELYLVKRSVLPKTISYKRIFMKIGIDENTHQIIDKYYFRILSTKRFYAPPYWALFDSWQCPDLPIGDFKILGHDDLSYHLISPKIVKGRIYKDMKKRIRAYKRVRRTQPFIRLLHFVKRIMDSAIALPETLRSKVKGRKSDKKRKLALPFKKKQNGA